MQIRYFLAASATALSLASFSSMAHAQSTGSVDFEDEEVIIVTGTKRATDVNGFQAPDATKAKAVLTQEFIEKQNPGQTILDTINQIPGVSFQNNDAYGSSGGTLTIRGFDASRISLTFDGVPLNDSGNYAIYSNQQIDPELIDQVNVNMGTTDVDSPTASAVGGTVNYRTLVPTEEFGVKLSGSAGEYEFMRIFGMVNTGTFTPFGTRAWFSASRATNTNPFNGFGQVNKQQYNARIYQPIGSGDDFVSLAGSWNINRNNFFGSLPLRVDPDRLITVSGVTKVVPRIIGSSTQNRYPWGYDQAEYKVNYPCQLAVGRPGVADSAATSTGPGGVADPNGDYASCGTEFDRRYNPSNTGNIRGSSKFSFGDKITLTIDPSYQYVKANGGGTATAREAARDINPAGATAGSTNTANCTTVTSGVGVNCQPGYWGGSPYFGRDLNGDGDILDQVTVMAPSQTQTHRLGVITNLIWNLNDTNTIRASYTWDRARHRQTGEVGLLLPNGEPSDMFPVNNGQAGSNNTILQKRDRLSYAILHKVAAEYRGDFFDEKLKLNIGVGLPYYRRNLTNYCFASSASGFVECSGQNATVNADAAAQNPYTATTNPTTGAVAVTGWAPPQNRVFNYSKLLPNVGVLYKFTPEISAFASYAKGLSVPGTDSLYNAFYFPLNTANAKPAPETTNTFDVGVRYRSSMIQAQAGAFLTKFKNRLASAYDAEIEQTVYRNLGDVDKWGFDGSIAFQPVPEFAFYFFGSYTKSKIKSNIAIGENANGTPIYAATAGKQESGIPTWQYGTTLRADFNPVEIGFTAKRTGPRYIYDTNESTYEGTYNPLGAVQTNAALGAISRASIFPAQAPAYWLINLDARINLSAIGLNDKSYFQLNVYNLMNNFYVGGFGGALSQTLSGTYNRATGVATYGNPSFVQIGAPRTISGTVTFAF